MTRRVRWLGVLAAGVSVVAACGTGERDAGRERPATASTAVPATSATRPSPAPPTTTTRPSGAKVYAAGTFDHTDTLLDSRVRAAGLSGGVVKIVAADGAVVHEHTVGAVTSTTPLAMASSTKWLTAITFLTFVDDGAIRLDDDIGRWLPEFAASDPPITARQLLDHTSGVHDNPCQNAGGPLAACVRTLASSPREFAAGSSFSYGNAPFLVVGRLVEVLGGDDFAAVVHRRLTGPLRMDDTTWPGAPGATNPAFGATVTVDDYGKLLDMVLHEGVGNGTRVLSSRTVREMLSNQVGAYDTVHDYSVGITKIPRYGLGCWLDVQDPSGTTQVASGNGGMGFYPWIDFATRTWGVVGVQDARGAELAVPASQGVELEARAAVAR